MLAVATSEHREPSDELPSRLSVVITGNNRSTRQRTQRDMGVIVVDALVFDARAGLANRLRALVGYRTLARRRSVPFYVRWAINSACGEEFHALFQRDGFEDLEFISADQMNRAGEMGGTIVSAGIWFADIWRRHAQGDIEQGAFYHESATALRSLTPVHAVRERIERFADARSIEHCTGVHIRMTDNLQHYDSWTHNQPDFDPENVSQLQGFERLIREREVAGKRVFLCTDNADVSKRLPQAYSNLFAYEKVYDESGFTRYLNRSRGASTLTERVMKRMRGLISGNTGSKPVRSLRTTHIADAVVDLFLLARCQSIVGTYYSSFAEVAAMIGLRPMAEIRGTQCVEHPAVHEMQSVLARHGETGHSQTRGSQAT